MCMYESHLCIKFASLFLKAQSKVLLHTVLLQMLDRTKSPKLSIKKVFIIPTFVRPNIVTVHIFFGSIFVRIPVVALRSKENV